MKTFTIARTQVMLDHTARCDGESYWLWHRIAPMHRHAISFEKQEIQMMLPV